ncbi:MAG: hypothetical protein VW522_01050 [Candidatus Neomarinimicrobiota bacterium]
MKYVSLIFLIIFNFGCSSKDRGDEKKVTQYSTTPLANKKHSLGSQEGKDYDACDCNRRSREILDKTIEFRLQFDNLDDLKKDQISKTKIKKFAKEYVKLTEKCFEINNARLLVDSECNNLRLLQSKKDSLRILGVQIEQGESIRL